jgi:vacuolar-type H+-ATPase subunit C/Vma6
MDYLEIRSKNTEYAYATGRIRGLEKHLLASADIARLEETGDLQECFETLARYYPYSQSLRSYESALAYSEALEDDWANTYRELHAFAPEPSLLRLFWLEEDFHNIKVLSKLFAQQSLPEAVADIRLLSRAGTIPNEKLYVAVAKADTRSVPQFLMHTIAKVRSLVEAGTSAGELEMTLDAGFFRLYLEGMHSYGDPFLNWIADSTVDAYNICTALRIILWERKDQMELMSRALTPGGSVFSRLMRLQTPGEPESLSVVLVGTPYVHPIEEAVAEWHRDESLTSLDRFLWERTRSFLEAGTYITFGREPLVQYVLLKRHEVGELRRIFRTKQAGVSFSID